MTTTERTYEPVHSVAATKIPGDHTQRLTRPLTCADGTVLPTGSLVVGLAGGCDNTAQGRGRRYGDLIVIRAGRA